MNVKMMYIIFYFMKYLCFYTITQYLCEQIRTSVLK